MPVRFNRLARRFVAPFAASALGIFGALSLVAVHVPDTPVSGCYTVSAAGVGHTACV